MKNKFRLKNKFKNKQLKSQMDRFRKMLLKDIEEIQKIFDEYVGGNSDNWRKVWTIYTFLVWYEEYFVKSER